jgi:hypothetical protein
MIMPASPETAPGRSFNVISDLSDSDSTVPGESTVDSAGESRRVTGPARAPEPAGPGAAARLTLPGRGKFESLHSWRYVLYYVTMIIDSSHVQVHVGCHCLRRPGRAAGTDRASGSGTEAVTGIISASLTENRRSEPGRARAESS